MEVEISRSVPFQKGHRYAFGAHVPEFIGIHGAIVPYTQQGLEKLNDSLTQFYYSGSNHRKAEALTQMLQKANRITHLSENDCQQMCSFCKNKDTIDEPVLLLYLILASTIIVFPNHCHLVHNRLQKSFM